MSARSARVSAPVSDLGGAREVRCLRVITPSVVVVLVCPPEPLCWSSRATVAERFGYIVGSLLRYGFMNSYRAPQYRETRNPRGVDRRRAITPVSHSPHVIRLCDYFFKSRWCYTCIVQYYYMRDTVPCAQSTDTHPFTRLALASSPSLLLARISHSLGRAPATASAFTPVLTKTLRMESALTPRIAHSAASHHGGCCSSHLTILLVPLLGGFSGAGVSGNM